MATFLGKILRGAVYSVTSPITAITGQQIAKNYVGDTSQLPTTKLQNWFTETIGIKAKDTTATTPTSPSTPAPTVATQLQDSITNLFSGVAQKIGTSAGSAAGSSVPAWLWPLVAVLGIVSLAVLLFKLFKKKGRR